MADEPDFLVAPPKQQELIIAEIFTNGVYGYIKDDLWSILCRKIVLELIGVPIVFILSVIFLREFFIFLLSKEISRVQQGQVINPYISKDEQIKMLGISILILNNITVARRAMFCLISFLYELIFNFIRNPLCIAFSQYLNPRKYTLHVRLGLEAKYVAKKHKIPENVQKIIEARFKHCYLVPKDFIKIKEEIEMLLKLSEKPTYISIKANQTKIDALLEDYKPAIQTQIRSLFFIIEKISYLASIGKSERIMILLVGRPGMGKTRLVNLLVAAFNLPTAIETNLEVGKDMDKLFGSSKERGHLTNARNQVGSYPNANLLLILNDIDRGLHTTSAFSLNILDPGKKAWHDPSLPKPHPKSKPICLKGFFGLPPGACSISF